MSKYAQILNDDVHLIFEGVPERITLADGSTRTSLSETPFRLTKEQAAHNARLDALPEDIREAAIAGGVKVYESWIGWGLLPLLDNIPTFDPATHQVSLPPKVRIYPEDRVELNYEVTPLPGEEAQARIAQTQKRSMDNIRDSRNTLLSITDWTQIPDNALPQEDRLAWAEFRQKLRDIPQNYETADAVKWPVEPQKKGK